MAVPPLKLSDTFRNFFDSEKSSGIFLIICTVASLWITNSSIGAAYLSFWQMYVAGLSFEHWINDGLMAIFFLLVGLELERELYIGELSNMKNALLPIFAAGGGMAAPALIHYSLNAGTPTQAGIGIPMATDIAFALGVLAILGNRVPPSLKVFVVAFAVLDDLGAIFIIAVFYTAQLSLWYLFAAVTLWGVLIVFNRLRTMSLIPYLIGGMLMWCLMLESGVHATIAGVMLAFAIPFTARDEHEQSPSHKLEHFLNKPVAFIILPVFALANTSILLSSDLMQNLGNTNVAGIIAGLLVGKPLGVTLLCYVAVASGISSLASDLYWRHVFGAGLLGGIGFTMSIFITNLAFTGHTETINASKFAIIFSSLMAGTIGFFWLKLLTKEQDSGKPNASTILPGT